MVVLLSDCLHTTAATRPSRRWPGIDRLHVLCPLPTPEAEAAARALAARGGGRRRWSARSGDVGPALTDLLA